MDATQDHQQKHQSCSCSCCQKELLVTKAKRCARCRQRQYCSRDCQTSDWEAQHKKQCKQLAALYYTNIHRSGAVVRVNIGSFDVPEDNIIEALPIGTGVSLYNYFDGKVTGFFAGKGKFSDPLYKETLEDARAMTKKFEEEELPYQYCSYEVTNMNGETRRVSCSDLHFEWTIETEQTDLEPTPPAFLMFPDTPQLLVVADHRFSKKDCFYSSGIRRYNNGLPIDFVDFNRPELIRLLQSGRYSTCFMIGVGSGGPSDLKLFSYPDLCSVLSQWVRWGGRLVVQGEGCIAKLLHDWTGVQWSPGSYYRCQQDLSASVAKAYSLDVVSYSCKAVYLHVEKEHNLFAGEDDNESSFAVKKVDAGLVAFAGDVNAETVTIKTILQIASASFSKENSNWIRRRPYLYFTDSIPTTVTATTPETAPLTLSTTKEEVFVEMKKEIAWFL